MQRTDSKAIDKMDAKKNRKASSTKKISGRSLVRFFGDVKQELRKVDWTSKDELTSYTKIVVISMFVFGTFVYFIDLFMQGLLGAINLVVKFLIG